MKRLLVLILLALPLLGADTVRDKAAVLALFADGQGAGSISPQDLRDFIVTALNTTTNAQTGTTYTILKSDRGKSVTHSNGASIAVTLPQATGADFGNGFWYLTKNLGAGAVTITPATSTIAGGATLVLATGQWALVVSNGTHYNVYGVRITGGTAITVTDAVTGQTVAVTADGIGTTQLDDAAATPGSGEWLQVDADDQAGLTYRSDAEALADLGIAYFQVTGPSQNRTYTFPDSAATIEYQARRGAASGYASLDGSTLVVENPANATATPTASKIPIAEGDGDLNAGWISQDSEYAWTAAHSFMEIEVIDPTDLASESLADTGFPNGTNWAEVGDFATPAGTAVYADSGHTGTLTQTSGQMDIAGVGYRQYKLTYVISSQSGDPACTITTAFAGSAETLTIEDGAQVNYFKSASSPGNYIISCTSSSGGFTMDDMSLKEIDGGDVIINGLLTGGGPTGLRVGGDGNIDLIGQVDTYNSQTTAGVGQPYILGNVAVTGASSAVGATNLVASATAGMYRISGYMQTTTLSVGACLSDVTLGWTYNSDVKALEVVSNHDQEVDETYSQIPPTIVRSDGAANITYIISLDAGGDCSNAVFDYYLVAERIQ